jgi:hypothetical protein
MKVVLKPVLGKVCIVLSVLAVQDGTSDVFDNSNMRGLMRTFFDVDTCADALFT